MKLFFRPEYSRAISKNSSRWLEHKFVSKFLENWLSLGNIPSVLIEIECKKIEISWHVTN
jgi:hypothetical protein